MVFVPKFSSDLDKKFNAQLLDCKKGAEFPKIWLPEENPLMLYVPGDNVTVEKSREDGISKTSVHWSPSPKMLKSVLGGQFVVLYDVERTEDAGQIQVVDGYFLHHLAPQNLEYGNKSVFFALGTSGGVETLDAIKARSFRYLEFFFFCYVKEIRRAKIYLPFLI